jgi:uncharacterized protein YbjT (DUF2867 family)
VIAVITDSDVVLAIGGAGHQGSSVVQRLRELGLPVRVLTDEPTSGEPRALRERGVDLARGNLDDRYSLDQALEGADHHLAACDQSRLIEDHLRRLGLSLTVLRPATIMEEIPWYWLSRLGRGAILATPYDPTTRLPVICLDDVAGLAARAITAPGRLKEETIEIAGDMATMAEVAGLLTQELHQPVRVTEVEVEGVFMLAETEGSPADIPWLRSLYPQLHTVSSWFTQGGGLQLCRAALARQAA